MARSIRPFLVIAVFAIVAAAFIWPRIKSDETTPLDITSSNDPGVVGLIVEPDDGRAPVLAELQAARTSIDALLYLLTDEPIINALIDAESRGVTVRVILDQYPFGGSGNPEETASTLRRAGIEVKWASSEFTFTHVKTFLVDDAVALIMNLNVSRSAFDTNREFAFVTTRPGDVATTDAIFEADWRGEPVTDPGALVVSPLNSRASLGELIASATSSVDIYAEVIRDDAMVAALIAVDRRGVRVRIVISPETDPIGVAILDELAAAGVEVRLVDRPYIHAKAILVDAEMVFIGSQNLTATSLDENREIGMIVDDPAITGRVEAVFERDFAAGTPVEIAGGR